LDWRVFILFKGCGAPGCEELLLNVSCVQLFGFVVFMTPWNHREEAADAVLNNNKQSPINIRIRILMILFLTPS